MAEARAAVAAAAVKIITATIKTGQLEGGTKHVSSILLFVQAELNPLVGCFAY